MKEQLLELLQTTLRSMPEIPQGTDLSITISACKDSSHGDYATNCAMILAKAAELKPRDLAEKIIAAFPHNEIVRKIEIAGPGFINFFLNEQNIFQIVATILEKKAQFGRSDAGKGERVHIEYVSANPTGPLHVGHGRGAAYGATVSNLLSAAGFNVHREYYVNDAGRQMRILTLSVWLRYLQQQEEQVALPSNAYQGQYIFDIATKLREQYGSRFHHTQESIETMLVPEENDEKRIDQLVSIAQSILGVEDFEIIFQVTLKDILDDIRDDLAEFGVVYDAWFHESQLFKNGLVEASLALLTEHGYVYENDGAKWFRATEFGDEKDRVLVRANGVTTYFASDVAYHLYKYRQGFEHIIDVFGADHHGYIARIAAFLKGLGEDPKRIHILLVQFAILYRGEERVSMSTRAGQFVTLRELRDEVGNDAARFFYVMRKPEQHLDFDLELAKSHSNENPVYYIQYAHARIASVKQQMQTSGYEFNQAVGLEYLSLLTTTHEKNLLTQLLHYEDTIKKSALSYEPHILAHYLLELANLFHSYYNAEKFLVEQQALRNARLCLIAAIQVVFQNGLTLLGISAPDKM